MSHKKVGIAHTYTNTRVRPACPDLSTCVCCRCLKYRLLTILPLPVFILTPPPTDYAKGFGGKFGVEMDKVDKSAVGFEYQAKTEKHESQKGWLCVCVF